MKKILLCCAAGMSTSLLVNKMKAVADEICGDVSEDGIYQYCLENELI